MKVALDPYMHRHVPLLELPKLVAELGYEYIELSPRADFLDWWVRPRVYPERIQAFKKSLRDHGVKLASLLPMYRWASPHQVERLAAMRYWKAAIQVAVELECDTMNSEFGRGPSPDFSSNCFCCTGSKVESCEAAFWDGMDELVPILELEGIKLNIEPHPEDFVETIQPAVDMIRSINSQNVRFLYCAPHTFHFGDDMARMIEEAAPVLAHVHVADTFNHEASSGLRYIINPPGAPVWVHQHLNIGEGEVDWEVFFGILKKVGFDGIVTSCVFAWEERAVESSKFMRKEIQRYVDKYWSSGTTTRPDRTL
jgi:myo-inositol catabolism protein IolH